MHGVCFCLHGSGHQKAKLEHQKSLLDQALHSRSTRASNRQKANAFSASPANGSKLDGEMVVSSHIRESNQKKTALRVINKHKDEKDVQRALLGIIAMDASIGRRAFQNISSRTN